jgi:hypothetical protein
MSGTCTHCGFSGTNDDMMEHAGNCPIMTNDLQPEETKTKLMNYLINIKLPFEALDDLEARQKAKEVIRKIQSILIDQKLSIKLQENFEDKSPRNIPL